jgi:hypothetical protein
VVDEKGDSSRAIRQYARAHGIRVTMPRNVDECRKGPFDGELYKQRNLLERLINPFKQSRLQATRYDKRGANYRAMWVIAAILQPSYGCSLQTRASMGNPGKGIKFIRDHGQERR